MLGDRPRARPTTDPFSATMAQSSEDAVLLEPEGSLALVREDARYAVQGELGQGGMGAVLLCRDARIGRHVAMKVIRDETALGGDLRRRFLREARIQGMLEHPAVTPVYDLGVDADGHAYFTMKRVRGETLERLLARLRDGDEPTLAKYTRHKLLAAFVRVCQAVDFAHRRGVVHRDLKPANVMLGDFGEVYVLDWGLAKLVAETARAAEPDDEPVPPEIEADAALGQTRAGALLGTPGYMAPEQLLVGTATAASDTYALGAVLFEILALEPLHTGTRVKDLVASTLEAEAGLPSARPLGGDVPPELDAICARATARRPAERHASAGELASAVERYLEGDRDVGMRRRLAAEHAALGATLAARVIAREGPPELRRTALRELGRALALDPDHAGAVRTMLELVMAPPAELPAEVAAELGELEREQVRVGGRTGALAFLSLNLYLPVFLWMGVRNVAMVVGCCLLSVAAAVTSYVVSRLPRARSSLAVLGVAALAFSSLAAGFGPFLVVPAIATANALVFSVSNGRRHRPAIIAIAAAGVLLPSALEWLGVVPPSFAFDAEGLRILPRMLELPPTATIVMLNLANVAVVVTSGLAAGPFRDELDDAQRRMRLFAWHLKHLVPEEALAGGAAAPPRR